VGLVFQYPEYQLFEETVRKDIAFGPRNMGLSEEEIQRRVEEAAAFCGLSAAELEKSPFELSGGQKRRAAIAGVIAMDPQILILDEPTAGLDPMGRDDLLEQIAAYHKERKNTVLLVSHSMEDIAKYSDRVLVMNASRAAMLAPTGEIFSRGHELQQMGLQVPQVTRIFMRLRELGSDHSSEELGTGTLTLYADRLECCGQVFPLDQLGGFALRGAQTVNFSCGTRNFEISSEQVRCTRKYMLVIDHLLALMPAKN
jgi:energy-coupling factor transporter ATP-binding protein EcfA2